jgi:uncharacterized protein (TIGR02147 family)
MGRTPSQFMDSHEEKHEIEGITYESFQVLADILYFSILETFELDGFQSNSNWIAEKLGVSAFEVSLALQKLERVGLLMRHKGFYKPTKNNLSTLSVADRSDALKHMQRQVLLKALDALYGVVAEERDQSTLTIALPKKAIPELKNRIKDFRRRMNQWLSGLSGKDEVYRISISAFPTRIKINEKR